MSTERRKGCGKRNQGKGTYTHTTSTSKARARRVACREGGGGGGGSCNPEEIQLLLLPVPPLRRHLRPSTPEANAAAQRRQRVSGSEAEGSGRWRRRLMNRRLVRTRRVLGGRGRNTEKGKRICFWRVFWAGYGWRAAAVMCVCAPQQPVLSVRGGWGPTATGAGAR